MDQYNKLEDPTDEENDMLDLAFGLTETLVPFLFHPIRIICCIVYSYDGLRFLVWSGGPTKIYFYVLDFFQVSFGLSSDCQT